MCLPNFDLIIKCLCINASNVYASILQVEVILKLFAIPE